MNPQFAPKNKTIRAQISDNKALVLSLLLCICLLAAIGWILFNLGNSPKNQQSEIDATRYTVEQLSQYPAAYLEARLPQYPSGEVTHFGSGPAQDGQPVVIYVKTNDGIKKAGDYYQAELTKNGWRLDKARSANADGIITSIYTKDSQEYHLTITFDEAANSSNIIISWHPAS